MKNPQVQAFEKAAEAMKAERYWGHENKEDQLDFLRAFSDVLTEVAYQLKQHEILDPAGLEAYRKVAPLSMPSFADTSPEVVLIGALQHRIEELEGESL